MGLDSYHHICNTCLATPNNEDGEFRKFQSCSSCKLVSYCGRSHQKQDWKDHKTFCLAVRKVLNEFQWPSLFSWAEEPSPQKLFEHQEKLIRILQFCLKRQLSFQERSMIYYPDICGLCLKPNGTQFTFCRKCKVQFYCCREHLEDHMKAHDKDCAGLRFGFELNDFLSKHMDKPPHKLYKKTLSPAVPFPSSLDEYFDTCFEMCQTSVFDRVLFGDFVSYLMTLVSGIREFPDVMKKSSLHVCVLGVGEVENYILSMLDIMFTWLPSVEDLNLVFVGPELSLLEDAFVDKVKHMHSNRNLNLAFHSCLYHELFTSGAEASTPDVVAAFNCGFHEFRGQPSDTWQETLDFILTQKNVVVIATSYTHKEAVEDSKHFVDHDDVITIVKLCEDNQYKSLNPRRNPERSESAVFYWNQFVSVYRVM